MNDWEIAVAVGIGVFVGSLAGIVMVVLVVAAWRGIGNLVERALLPQRVDPLGQAMRQRLRL
jgi:hypothetical protein